jgi:hypothetical protein
MLTKMTTCALCLGAFLLAGPVSAVAHRPATDDVTAHTAGASRALQAYSRSRSIDDLRAAVYEMVAAGNFVAQRRTVIRGWAQVFKAIEDSYDPTFDPADRKNRPDWQHANQQQMAEMKHYLDVQHVDMLAQSSLKVQLDQFRKVEPDGPDADFAALDGILQQAGLSSARRMKISSMFYAHPGG